MYIPTIYSVINTFNPKNIKKLIVHLFSSVSWRDDAHQRECTLERILTSWCEDSHWREYIHAGDKKKYIPKFEMGIIKFFLVVLRKKRIYPAILPHLRYHMPLRAPWVSNSFDLRSTKQITCYAFFVYKYLKASFLYLFEPKFV